MNTTVLTKELSIGSKPVKVLLEGNSAIWICVHDLCRVMSRPQFMCTNPVFSMCPSAQKIKFKKNKDSMWGIRKSDVAKYFYLIRQENAHTERMYKQIVSWAESLTPEIIINAPGVGHTMTPTTSKGAKSAQEITIYQYNGRNISFLNGTNMMVNATQMAAAFNKVPKDWLRNQSTKEFISTLSTVRQIRPTELITKQQGGNGEQGTWMHEDVAIEFARWLSPTFAIWCNDRIKELLSHGITAMPDTIEQIIADPSFAIKTLQALQEERQAKELAIRERNDARSQVRLQKPKADYYDAVIESRELYTTLQIAGELGMCYRTLRLKLFKLGVVATEKGPMYASRGYEDWGEMVITPGPKHCSFLRWNKRGREGIFALINPTLPV